MDDNPANLKLLRMLLDAQGHSVDLAVDAADAWRALESSVPDVILMDLQLPGTDGFELTRRIKAEPRLQSVRVLALTAYAMKGDEAKARDAGCDGYLSKPFDPADLAAELARLSGLPRA